MSEQHHASLLLTANQIRQLLVELGRRLDQRGIQAEMFVVVGAAIALAYTLRRVTRDLDAVFEPKTEIYDEAELMAQEYGLPSRTDYVGNLPA